MSVDAPIVDAHVHLFPDRLFEAIYPVHEYALQAPLLVAPMAWQTLLHPHAETGMAMMGSAIANGADRARTAAERAIASPLLEDVDMSGARGVLVNITSSSSLKLKEIDDVMECVQFAAEEATVIVGSVFDEAMGDELRVTVVATGLGAPMARKQPKPEVVYRGEELRTGTDNEVVISNPGVNYTELDTPAVMRRGRRETIDAMEKSGMEMLDIPSFLRRQAD